MPRSNVASQLCIFGREPIENFTPADLSKSTFKLNGSTYSSQMAIQYCTETIQYIILANSRPQCSLLIQDEAWFGCLDVLYCRSPSGMITVDDGDALGDGSFLGVWQMNMFRSHDKRSFNTVQYSTVLVPLEGYSYLVGLRFCHRRKFRSSCRGLCNFN